ncbi:MAG: hypothetical protein ACI9R3_006288, partial [Verrucomicrobiales bacterium]
PPSQWIESQILPALPFVDLNWTPHPRLASISISYFPF